MVVPRGISNPVAMDLIIRHVKSQLQLTGHTFRKDLPEVHADERAMPSTLHVLKQTQQVCGLHTIIRNRETVSSVVFKIPLCRSPGADQRPSL